MGCSTSTQTQESNRPVVKPEENNGANICAPLDVNSPIADESEMIPDQSVLNQLKETDTLPEENVPTESTRPQQTVPLEDVLSDCTPADSAQAATEETVEPATEVEEVIQDASVDNPLEDTAAVQPTLLETVAEEVVPRVAEEVVPRVAEEVAPRVAEEVAPRVTGTMAEESPTPPDTLTEVALGPSDTEAEMAPSLPEAATELQETAEGKHIEDETGEKVKGETQQEAASQEPETKECETGEMLKAAVTELVTSSKED
ncbi:glutamate-rich protein 5-like isoform X1 [Acipenser ruthenus]|uniref:glutamate-rich protein 5-like isoform X1 n=1 Tax=Acipenser ruthenus TaxID=7906 RepID=UPI00145A7586|nr:glutamate-rich protein 5-like isoform X1 [Acipenser ruthenus]